MGIKHIDVNNVFKDRIKLALYEHLPREVREVVDYTVKESLKSNPDLKLHFIRTKTIKPKVADLWFLKWLEVIELKMALSENRMLDVLKLIYGISDKDMRRLELFNSMAVFKWVAENLKQMVDIEVAELGSEPSDEEKEAGIEELQEFGYSLAVDGIAKGKIWKHDKVKSMVYADVFVKMCMDKKRYDINKTISENASRKNQTVSS